MFERDGSLEAVWVADVNGDLKEDGLVVVRNGGSGSYVELLLLKSVGGGYEAELLSGTLPAGVKGYMGHDRVMVSAAGEIFRSFATYEGKGLRVDRQWEVKDGLRGEGPVKVAADSNAGPSGVTVKLRFNMKLGAWELVGK